MIIAVDTGGTKTFVANFTDSGQIWHIAKFPTPKNIDAYIQRTADQIKLIADGAPITIISMALPGVTNNDSALWCPNLGWHDIPIRSLMSRQFPDSQIILANDANMAGAASMQRLNSVPNCGLYITIGTGIGTSIILDGTIPRQLSNCEGGHMRVIYDNHETSWEDIASGRTLRSLFGELSHNTPAPAWNEIADRLMVGLQPLIAFIQPDTVVIGGILGELVPKFVEILKGGLAEKLPAAIKVPRIIGAPYSEKIVLYGCYDNAIRHTA